MESSSYDLAVVIPIYNEEGCIWDVVRSWSSTLSSLKINYKMILLNDGSQDKTMDILNGLRGDPRLEIINKQNSGHGPTILLGYKKACEAAQWVFQCDGDDEIKAEHFPKFWENRDKYDAIFGRRVHRVQPLSRKLVSAVSRSSINLLFKNGIEDANAPYRLIRASALKKILAGIPEDTFAPNLIISGVLALNNFRILNIPVEHTARRTGTVSIKRMKLFRAALKAFWQILKFRLT